MEFFSHIYEKRGRYLAHFNDAESILMDGLSYYFDSARQAQFRGWVLARLSTRELLSLAEQIVREMEPESQLMPWVRRMEDANVFRNSIAHSYVGFDIPEGTEEIDRDVWAYMISHPTSVRTTRTGLTITKDIETDLDQRLVQMSRLHGGAIRFMVAMLSVEGEGEPAERLAQFDSDNPGLADL